MQVWCVSPAWKRPEVTRLALLQREHAAQALAARGVTFRTVLVTDDENVDVASAFSSVEVVEFPNDRGLGAKFNAGYQYAADQGADWMVHIGSDDWLHPDTLLNLGDGDGRTILAGRQIAFVDLLGGQMRHARLSGPHGVIPWVIPRRLLEAVGFAPIQAHRDRGMDGYLVRGLRRAGVPPRWRFRDPNPVARVDWKSAVNVNPWDALQPLTGLWSSGLVDPWTVLREHYPGVLVDEAIATHEELSACRS